MKEKKSVHKFALEKKIVEMIDVLERSGAFESRADIIATAIRNLHEEQKVLETDSSTHSETPELLFEYKSPGESVAEKQQFKHFSLGKEIQMAERVSATPYPETFRDEYSEQENPEVFLQDLMIDELKKICSDMSEVERLCDRFGISDKEVMHHGEGGAGLVWNLHNRILPIKFVLHVIAYEITKTGKQFVDIEDLKDSVALELEEFTTRLRVMEVRESTGRYVDYKLDITFPDDKASARDLPRMRKIRGRRGSKKKKFNDEVMELVKNSRNRFIDTFVGKRANAEEKSDARFDGACFEMGLLAGNENNEITLTESGVEFVVIKNPVIDAVINGFPSTESVFSEHEVDFIIRNIFLKPNFALECKIISDILGSSENLSLDEVANMMSDRQKDYVLEIRKKNPDKKFDDIDELMEKLKGPLGTRAVRQRATATTTRLVELGLLVRGSKRQEKRPPKTIYSSTDLGKRIYEGILLKN